MPLAVRYLNHFVGGAATTGGVLPIGLKTITLNSTAVTDLPANFFHGFNTVETIKISNVITKFGAGAFTGMTSLKNLVLPTALTLIDNDAFTGTTQLTTLVIPQTVTILGVSAFRGSNLADVRFEGALPTIASSTSYVQLFGINFAVKVYVTQAYIESFKTVIAFNDLFTQTPSRLLTYTPGE